MLKKTQPFNDQNPGTSGLRKKVSVFKKTNYLENFVQSVFDTSDQLREGILVLGGDGRYYNDIAIQTILRMAAANNIKKVIVGKDGILSTPAASYWIRKYKAQGGIILSASHNPAGIDGDFGIKYNIENGGPAPESFTDSVYEKTLVISEYKIIDHPKVDISNVGTTWLEQMQIDVLDSVIDYTKYMMSIFDFAAIEKLFSDNKFKFKFDAMHAVTGPYAKYIFIDTLHADSDCVINGVPLSDFGGGHPDPNLTHAKELVSMTKGDNGVDFAAASDGDGDRNMILGKNFFVTPSDSLAFILANHDCIPFYKNKTVGVARSMPTSQAADRVADKLDLNCFETPTGWKFFGNLLDDNQITFCGEESFGTSSNHVREKDGLWAVLAWLHIIAIKQKSVADLMLEHWNTYGRNFYTRYDYEAIDLEIAESIVNKLSKSLPDLVGCNLGNELIVKADQFSYTDPIDGSVSSNQGTRIICESGARVICRLSGTGTQGATLRVYLEVYTQDPSKYHLDCQEALKSLIQATIKILDIENLTGMVKPSVIT